MKLALDVVEFTCRACGTSWQIPSMDWTPYGFFLLRSKTGHLAYLEAVDDPVFSEVGRIISDLRPALDAEGSAALVHCAFGVTTDPDPTGHPFEIHVRNLCPRCSSRQWESRRLDSQIEADADPVGHKSWERLTDSERRQGIRDRLAECESHQRS